MQSASFKRVYVNSQAMRGRAFTTGAFTTRILILVAFAYHRFLQFRLERLQGDASQQCTKLRAGPLKITQWLQLLPCLSTEARVSVLKRSFLYERTLYLTLPTGAAASALLSDSWNAGPHSYIRNWLIRSRIYAPVTGFVVCTVKH